MTMKFYNALQMDPAVLKREIAACETRREKIFYRVAMAVHSVLIVAFAIVFISLLSGMFGADNTPLAVALFCMMLGIRFVNFEYCIGDSLITLAAVLVMQPELLILDVTPGRNQRRRLHTPRVLFQNEGGVSCADDTG